METGAAATLLPLCTASGSTYSCCLLLQRQVQRCNIWQAPGASVMRCRPRHAGPAACHTRAASLHAMLLVLRLLLAWRKRGRLGALLLSRQVRVGIPQRSHGSVHSVQASLDAGSPGARQAAAQRLQAALGGHRSLLVVPAGRQAQTLRGRPARQIFIAAAMADTVQLADCHAAPSRLLWRQCGGCLGMHARRLADNAQCGLPALCRWLSRALGGRQGRRRSLLPLQIIGWLGGAPAFKAAAVAGRELALGAPNALHRVRRGQAGWAQSRRSLSSPLRRIVGLFPPVQVCCSQGGMRATGYRSAGATLQGTGNAAGAGAGRLQARRLCWHADGGCLLSPPAMGP